MFLVWQNTIVNDRGDIQPGAFLEIKYQESGANVPLYADSDGTTPVNNPVQADAQGFVRVYVRNEGRTLYRIRAFRNGFERVWENELIGIGEPRTQAEISSGVTPVDYAYPEGNVRRYGAKGDGVTDDTTAIRSCLAVQHRFPTFPDFSAGPGKVYFPPGEYVVSDTLFFQYCEVEFAEGARIFVNDGDFNVISFGRGVLMYNPCVWVFSTTFKSAVYYVSGEHLFQSVDDSPRVIFPTCFGNSSIINNGSKAYHLHSYHPNTQYSGPQSSAISFCRFYGAKANAFNYFALIEADGSHPDTMQAYCNSNLFTDFVFSLCRRGVEINATSDSNGCVANKLHGHCNAFTNYGGVGAERAVYVNSDENNIDIHIWDWALELPSSAVILDTEADRNDIVIRGQGIHRVSDSGGGNGANRIRAEGTAGGNASESFRGAMLSRGIDLSGSSMTHETELTGFSGTAPSGSFRLTRSGGFVEIRVPPGGVSGTSNESTMLFATPLPDFFRPVGEKRVAIWVQDNGAFVPGIAVIGTDGSVRFGVGASTGGFATSGTKGLLTSASIVFSVY